MRRREFIALGGAAAWPLVARGQQPERMRRIGVLMNVASDDPEGQARIAAFRQELQQLGWTDGRDVRIDYRWAGDAGRFQRYAEELLALAPDVILASATPSVQALQQVTRTVPIVFANVGDPVGMGLVASLARPRREHHRFFTPRIRLRREVAGAAQRDRTSRDAGGGASGSYHRAGFLERDPGCGAVV
jgi:putative tryptophan/tyrosine transport system substrate-binding protein